MNNPFKEDGLIHDFFKYKVWNKIYYGWSNFTQGIENLIIWFKVIWGDRDFDSYFLMIIMKKKLERMEKYFREYGHYVGVENDAKKMRICIELLDRLIKDEYEDRCLDKLEKKWGEFEFEFKDLDSDRCTVVSIEREKVKTEEDAEKYRKEHMRAYEEAAQLKKNDKEYLFKLLNKYLFIWWD